jgi:hypothetical protein
MRAQFYGLHPDDARELVRRYHALLDSNEPLVGPIKLTGDLSALDAPEFGRDSEGEQKPFGELTPEEKAEAFVDHQLTTAATVMANDARRRAAEAPLEPPEAPSDREPPEASSEGTNLKAIVGVVIVALGAVLGWWFTRGR